MFTSIHILHHLPLFYPVICYFTKLHIIQIHPAVSHSGVSILLIVLVFSHWRRAATAGFLSGFLHPALLSECFFKEARGVHEL